MTNLSRIAITPRGRCMLFGMTGCGKSTVKEQLVQHWRETMQRPRVLILDSKPRFRAEWELNGITAKRRYKKWQRGPNVPGSVALPFIDPVGDLAQVWRLGYTVAIAQTGDQAMLPWLRAYAMAFYAKAEDKYDQLLDVDECADFFGTSGAARQGDALLKVVRSGREMNVSFVGAAQRPKGLPHSFLTELSEVFLFTLASAKDLEHLEDMGLPGDVVLPDIDHIFYHFRRKGRQAGMFRLDLPGLKGKAS